jgi:hypothetical protein
VRVQLFSNLHAAGDRWWLALPVLSVLMLAPTLWHGKPYLFYDTAQYYEYGAKLSGFVIEKIAGATTRPTAAEPAGGSNPAHQTAGEPERTGIAFYGARSPFYSVWFYALLWGLGIWAVLFTQALAISWLIWRVATHTLTTHRLAWAAAATALATLGGGAWFTLGFLMPDVYAAAALGAGALLFAYGDRMTLVERLGIAGLLAASAAFHATHLVIAAAVCGAGIAVAWLVDSRKEPFPWPAARLVAAALLLVVAAQLAYSAAARVVLGASLMRPPFAMARIIMDGPGRLYLAENCGRSDAFAVCAYRDRPFKTTDDFLWEGEAAGGVYQTVPLSERLRLGNEELSFVAAVAVRYPLSVLRAVVANTVEQMLLVGPDGWFDPGIGYSKPAWANARVLEALPFIQDCVARPGSCVPSVPAWLIRWINSISVVIAFVTLAVHFVAIRARDPADGREESEADERHRRTVFFALLIVAGLIVNAAVCGAISYPVHRYQTRVVWLAVVAAVMLEAAQPIVLSRIFRWKWERASPGDGASSAHRELDGNRAA